MIDRIIAYHCAPALAGIKPANIISCLKQEYPNVETEIERLNACLNGSDIYLEILCSCEKRAMVMIYRKKRLESYISRPEISMLLSEYGYPEARECVEYIDHLKKRIAGCGNFPHEIGAFLGYPIKDIYGFISGSSKCLHTGYWKVYDDVEGSKRCFRRYDMCRAAVIKRIDSGSTLESLFGARKTKCA